MKQYIKGIITLFAVFALFAACKTDKVMMFEPTDCVYFKVPGDTSRFSFALLDNPEVESAVFTVNVDLAGAMVDRDRQFSARVIKDATNSQTRYEIIDPSVVKAGDGFGTIEIRVWQTPNLSVERDTITIELVGSDYLIADFATQSTRCITFYNGIDKPAWWNSTMDGYLGKYHEIKMQILKIVLGSMDNPRTEVNAWPYYQVLLNTYCEENDIRYPEDNFELRFLKDY